MTIHTISFFDPPNCSLYDYIRRGIKTVEGRKISPKYQNYKKDDTLIINDEKGLLICKILYVNQYKNVREYLEKEGLDKTVPCVKTVDEAINIYRNFISNKELNNGFLGIGISFIKEHKKHYVNLKEPWFTYIKNGLKTVEGRLNKGKFTEFTKDDIIIFQHNDKKINAKITGINKYNNFSNMLKNKTLKRVLPNITSNQEGVNIYHQFYTPQDEKEYGVLAISFELL